MKVYQSKPRITLSPAIRDGQKYVEVEFDEDDAIRLSLSKEKGVRFEGDRAYLPEEGFDLSGFFDRLCRNTATTAVQRAYRPCVHHLLQGVPAILCGKKSPLHPTGRNQRLHRAPD